jgi:hypothetical protein
MVINAIYVGVAKRRFLKKSACLAIVSGNQFVQRFPSTVDIFGGGR